MDGSQNPYAPTGVSSDAVADGTARFEKLAGTETGLKIVYYGIVLLLLGIIAGFPVSLVVPQVFLVVLLMVAVGWFMHIVGPFFCLSAPAETKAKSLIVISVICQTTALMIGFASLYLRIDGMRLVGFLGSLLGATGTVFFVLFMMRIATYIGRIDLSDRGRNILIGTVLLFCLGIVTIAEAAIQGPFAGILSLALTIGIIIVIVVYSNLINSLFKAIGALRSPFNRVL